MHYTDRFPALTNKYYRQRETHSTFGCQYTYNAAVAAAAVYTYSERLTILFSVAFSLWCDVNSVMYQKKKSRRERGKSTATYYRRASCSSSLLCCSIYPGYVYTAQQLEPDGAIELVWFFRYYFFFFSFFFFCWSENKRKHPGAEEESSMKKESRHHSTAQLWIRCDIFD
jgi:hypothetical protein